MDESHLRSILNGFTGAEMEFLCEDEIVDVVPSFSQEAIPLLGTDNAIGPFQAAVPVSVPLWMAIALKKQVRATIVPPAWMQLDSLTEWRDDEKRSDAFVRPPSHAYIEIARVLLHYARDDIEKGTSVPSKDLEERLGDIQDIRQAKIKKGLDQINTHTPFILLNNMSSMELNTIRTFYCTALSRFQRLHAASEDTSLGVSQDDSIGGDGMRGPAQASDSQRRAMRRNANMGAASQSSSQPGQPASTPTFTQPSQPGVLTQAAEQGLSQARKLRRFQ